MIMVMTVTSSCLFLNIYTKESLAFVNCKFNDKYDIITLWVRNSGTTDVMIKEILLDYGPYLQDSTGLITISAGETRYVSIYYHWSSERRYIITLVTCRENVFSVEEYAPRKEYPLEIENVIWNSTANAVTIVLRNVGTKEREIIGLGMATTPDDEYLHATSYTDIGTGKYIQADQIVTVILNWPLYSFGSSWISGKTYYFYISTETGPDTIFTSKAPI
jgi:hypothetical protein